MTKQLFVECRAGLPEMLANAKYVIAYLNALAEKREPEHTLDDVLESAEDLAADLATLIDDFADEAADQDAPAAVKPLEAPDYP